jgi:hypothetical protein
MADFTTTLTLIVGTIPVQVPPVKGGVFILIKSISTNTGNVYVGMQKNSLSPSDGIQVTANGALGFPINDSAKVWLVADSSGQVVDVLISTAPNIVYSAGNFEGTITSNVNVAKWGGTSTSLGQKVMASSVPVAISSDQSGIPVGTESASVNVGQTTSGTSAVQLSATSIASTNGILVQAISTNTASVFIGGSGVTTGSGFELQAGQAVPFTASNITALYVVGSNITDKVCWNVM